MIKIDVWEEDGKIYKCICVRPVSEQQKQQLLANGYKKGKCERRKR